MNILEEQYQFCIVTRDGKQVILAVMHDGQTFTWLLQDIFSVSHTKQVKKYAIEKLGILDNESWFQRIRRKPTLRAITEEFHRIEGVDLSIPILMIKPFGIVDGYHRIAKAHLRSEDYIDCVEFSIPELMSFPHHKTSNKITEGQLILRDILSNEQYIRL